MNKRPAPNKPAASNAGGFRRWTLIKPENNRGKENIKQVNPALAAAGRPLGDNHLFEAYECTFKD